MAKKAIPEEIKQEVIGIISRFNAEVLRDPTLHYTARFRGRFAYLDRYDHDRGGPICRLEYTGDMSDWGFAIYKYSNDRYDVDEWLFPGSEFVNGTVEGALRAGMKAYPRSPLRALDSRLASALKALLGLGNRLR